MIIILQIKIIVRYDCSELINVQDKRQSVLDSLIKLQFINIGAFLLHFTVYALYANICTVDFVQ